MLDKIELQERRKAEVDQLDHLIPDVTATIVFGEDERKVAMLSPQWGNRGCDGGLRRSGRQMAVGSGEDPPARGHSRPATRRVRLRPARTARSFEKRAKETSATTVELDPGRRSPG